MLCNERYQTFSGTFLQDGMPAKCLPLPFLRNQSVRKSRKEVGPLACFTPRPSSPPRIPLEKGETTQALWATALPGCCHLQHLFDFFTILIVHF
jgi:hypothetical protein